MIFIELLIIFYHGWILELVRWVFCVSWLCSHLQLVDTVDYTFFFPVLTQPCISGINPTRSWCIIFLYVTGFDLLLFFGGVLYLSYWEVLVCNILSFGITIFVWCWCQRTGGLINELCSTPSSSVFWKSLCKIDVSSSENIW